MTVQSKTDQIIEILRAEIRQSKTAVGSRVSSVRDLAQRFGVCTRSISIALEQLQLEKLVVCKHGKGVFVNNWRQSDIIEVFLLLWNQYDYNDSYREMLMAMTYPPHLRRGFRFNIRAVFDDKLNQAHLEQEVRNIAAMGGIDCMLINTSGIEPATLPLFQKLHLPTIFLGDFSHEGMEDAGLNQITGDSFMSGYRCIEFMHWQGQKETLLLMPGDTFYYKLFLNGAMKAASDFGVALDYRCISYPSNCNLNEMKKAQDGVIAQLDAKRLQSTPIITYGGGAEQLAQILGKYKNKDSPPRVTLSSQSKYSQLFYDTVFARIKDLSRNHSSPQRIRLEFPLLLTDIITHQQWLYQQHFKVL